MELNFHTDVNKQHVNMLPRTAYKLPYTSLEEYQAHPERHHMQRVTSLNGTWGFQYFASLEQFYQRSVYAQKDTIEVPSVWNLKGYDQLQYCNVQFPIPFDLPHVPNMSSCGYYEKTFTIKKYQEELDYHLTFEGVSGAHYIWVNGEFVGYAQISHALSQFDITELVTEGDNHIAVLVLKYSDATYFEDQDMFRHSGIYRDVYIVGRQRQRLNDYQIHTTVENGNGYIDVTVQDVSDGVSLHYQLLDPDQRLTTEGTLEGTTTRIHVPEPQLWSAEHPDLYTLIIEANGEFIVQYVGIREVEIDQQQLWINGQSVKLRGVNYHDSHPQTGYTVSEAQLIKDLTLMKKANFNAIRTAHYPKSQRFYELTDQYGFYVMSEADLETHGVVLLYGDENLDDFNLMMDDPRYEQAVVDRIDASIVPFKNFSSIISWSMGNESGYGCNMERGLAHAKTLDASRPLHYEGAHYAASHHDRSNLDMISRMYPSPEEIETRYLTKPNLDKPFVLCEYAHAMGNSPGGLKAYHDLIERYDSFIGGFVWEWCDHAVQVGMKEGRPIYRYGGDFGEKVHDGHFCVDGIVSPDRKPHAGYYEFQQVHRPLVYVAHEGTRVTFKNQLDFTNIKDYVALEITVTTVAGDTETFTVDAPDIAPHAHGDMDIASYLHYDLADLSTCTIQYILRADHPLLTPGEVLGHDQIIFQRIPTTHFVPETTADVLDVKETKKTVQVKRGTWCYTFDKQTGGLQQVTHQQTALLKEGSQLNIWRAPTDNDIQIQQGWRAAKYDTAYPKVYQTNVQQQNDHVIIAFDMSMVEDSRPRLVEGTVTWTVYEDGMIHVAHQLRKDVRMPSLPRLGITFSLPDRFQALTYYGQGPFESYQDKQEASHLALFHTTVRDQYEHPIFPQEVGAHIDTTYVGLCDDNYTCAVWSDAPFSMNAKPYSDAMLTEANHDDELEETGVSYLHIDAVQSGIGTNSCGPELPEQYRLLQEQYQFDFKLKFYK
ncbi:glycoside hydrolase family 2 TIM barrel-domain containing protein [Staphylococcus intermedius]|uniref:Beta-galactosidase n=1 Tax=Staphylococcus intermedius NCTC 11048 TaxID=1141106 RepID=A0A380G4L2_STAIN|nr:glycoside hydrolase family 2 TIM barrel-domain containing protein [Staphylococcus intermedius]PCF64001.1 beta-galactosidase [Staphylococcus intermedius]PCF78716.1 beta-galactosidase [Staphylococcus intermedius]PCF79689.1 beta-galactosidase [Staphylococcus intermedius]PCF85961.1 beta-galactosidase [Staphylococcus intermedius]PCF89652.1 beta-galactosidase [Staphylococcus intermedius]